MRLSQIESVLGASRFDAGNWIKRQNLTSLFEEVVSGQARHFSYKNTIELALIAAFVAAGMPVSKAVAFARSYVSEASSPGIRLGDTRNWLVSQASDFSGGIKTNDPKSADLDSLLKPGSPPVFVFVNIGEVFRRVDQLFFDALDAGEA